MSCNCNHIKCDHSLINGNSIDINIEGCESEIKADIVVSEFCSIRLWGQIKTCNGAPVKNALLKLVKVNVKPCGCEYQGIAHTVSDCNGFYQFDLCDIEKDACYKVIVGKASTGCERTISTQGNCQPCLLKSSCP